MHDHALANSGTTDIFKRTDHGEQKDGQPTGMCPYPCAQGEDNKQDLSKDGGKYGDGGEYNKGSDDDYEGEYEKEAGKYIKDKVSDSAFFRMASNLTNSSIWN